MTRLFLSLSFLYLLLSGCSTKQEASENDKPSTSYPPQMVHFTPLTDTVLFTGTGISTWDKQIRERGFILKEGDLYKMWYSGYNYDSLEQISLGYATSPDGIHWTRYPDNPIFSEYWTEDMHVTLYEGKYYLYAEGVGDIAHLLTSNDGIHWNREGDLEIRLTNGQPLPEGPYGTPSLYIEDGKWYLFYERNDTGIWVATSSDGKVWTNIQDDPVIAMGPEPYDKFGVAVNQIVKYEGRYYAYYHGTAFEDWSEWSVNVAVSEDLVHWTKYPENPVIGADHSSPVLVHDGEKFRLYTMHDKVKLFSSQP